MSNPSNKLQHKIFDNINLNNTKLKISLRNKNITKHHG